MLLHYFMKIIHSFFYLRGKIGSEKSIFSPVQLQGKYMLLNKSNKSVVQVSVAYFKELHLVSQSPCIHKNIRSSPDRLRTLKWMPAPPGYYFTCSTSFRVTCIHDRAVRQTLPPSRANCHLLLLGSLLHTILATRIDTGRKPRCDSFFLYIRKFNIS